MVLIFPALVLITALASFMMFQFGLPLWLPIVLTIFLVVLLSASIYLSYKHNTAKAIIVYGATLLVLALLMIIFEDQITAFVDGVLSPIGPGGLPPERHPELMP